MTKDELKKEAEESADKWIKWAIDHKSLEYWNSYVDGYLASAEPREKQIADLKANFDYVLEGKDLEIKTLGERCNQLLKDKGDLTDELQACKEKLAQTIENDEVAYETLKLHDQEEIGMLKAQIEKLKADIEQAIEDANRWEETETFSVLNRIYYDNFENTKGVSNG